MSTAPGIVARRFVSARRAAPGAALCVAQWAAFGAALWCASVAAGEVEWRVATEGGIAIAPRDETFADESTVDTLLAVDVALGEREVVERYRVERFYANVAAVQEHGDAVVPFDSSTERLVMRRAAVVGPDGTVHHASEADARVLDRDSYDVLTDGKDLVVQLPTLAPGSTSVIEYERIVERSALPVNWSMAVYPRSSIPRQQVSVTVRWEGEAPLIHNGGAGGVTGLECEPPASGRLTCSGNGFAAIERDPDVNYLDVMPQLVISEPSSWDEVTATLLAGVDRALADDAGLDELYESIVAPTDTQDQRLAKLYGFASEAVRYVSLAEGEHDVVPHAVSRTIAKRYGDCKDKSALLLALLRKDGRAAWPTLVATDRGAPERLVHPGTQYFDHMVVCLETPAGERCLDPTSAYSGAGYSASGIQGAVRLDLAPGSEPGTIPADVHRWRMAVDTNIVFDAAGGQREETQRRYLDAYSAVYRANLAGRSPADREAWLLDGYHSVITDSVTPSFGYGGLESPSEPVTISSTARYESLATPGEPLRWTENAHWLRRLTGYLRFENDHYPYAFPGIEFSGRYRFELGPSWQPRRAPAMLNLSHEFGQLTREVRIDDDAYDVTFHVTMPSVRLPVSSRERFNAFLDVVNRESSMHLAGTVERH